MPSRHTAHSLTSVTNVSYSLGLTSALFVSHCVAAKCRNDQIPSIANVKAGVSKNFTDYGQTATFYCDASKDYVGFATLACGGPVTGGFGSWSISTSSTCTKGKPGHEMCRQPGIVTATDVTCTINECMHIYSIVVLRPSQVPYHNFAGACSKMRPEDFADRPDRCWAGRKHWQ